MEATITNTAVITANVVTPITVRETINAEEQSLLTITKSVSPVPVTENGTLTYTFVIQNMGNTAATYTQDTTTGAWGINPGVSTLVISGTV